MAKPASSSKGFTPETARNAAQARWKQEVLTREEQLEAIIRCKAATIAAMGAELAELRDFRTRMQPFADFLDKDPETFLQFHLRIALLNAPKKAYWDRWNYIPRL